MTGSLSAVAPMTVYWVNQYAVPPDQPGGTRHFDFAAELGRRGHTVRLVASDLSLTSRQYSRRRDGRDLRTIDESIDGVQFTWLTAGSYEGNDWRRVVSMVVFGVVAFAHLLRVPRRPGTVFIGSSPQLFAALGAWAAARCRRVPFVFEVRDLWPESYTAVSGKADGIEVTLMRRIADLLYHQAAVNIVLAEPNVERVAARGVDASAIVVVPNGVDMAAFDAPRTPERPAGESAPFTFIYAGAHGPANGLDVVVRAARILQDSGRTDIRTVLVGDGPAKPELRRLAVELGVDAVEFRDPVAKDEIQAILASADAGLMILADVELFSYGVSPNKLFDYLGAGLPVLTNVPGLVSGIVEDAGAGRCVAPGDPEALAEGMVRLADDPVADAATNGRNYVRTHYDRRRLVDRVEELLGTL